MIGVLYTALSPDGRLVATSGFDGSIALWNSTTSRLLWRTSSRSRGQENTRSSEPGDLQFSQNGDLLVQSQNKHVNIWDIRKGKRIHKISLENKSDEEINDVSKSELSRDGRYLLTYRGGTAEIWDTSTWKSWQKFKDVTRAAFTPDSASVVLIEPKKTKTSKIPSIGAIGTVLDKVKQAEKVSDLANKRFFTISIFDIASKKKIAKEANLDFNATQVRFSPSGKYVAVTGVDLLGSTLSTINRTSLRFKTAMQILETKNLAKVLEMPREEKTIPKGISEWILQLWNFPGDFSRNDEKFIVAYKNQITVWDIESKTKSILPEQKRSISSISGGSINNEILVGDSTGATLIDTNKGTGKARFEGFIADTYYPKFSRDGKKVFVRSSSFRLEAGDLNLPPWSSGIWSLESGTRVGNYDRPGEYLADQNDQHILSLNLQEKKAYLYDPITTNIVSSFDLPLDEQLQSMTLSPKSTFIVLNSGKNVKFMDSKTGKVVKEDNYNSIVDDIFFSSDEEIYLVSSSDANDEFVGELKSFKKRGNLADSWMRRQKVKSMSLSNDGKLCALLLPNRIDLYSVATQKKVLQIPLSKEPSSSCDLSFSQNGERLFYADEEAPLAIYLVASGQLEKTIESLGALGGFASNASDSADGLTLAVSGFDGFTRFIDRATGEERCALTVQENGEWFVMAPNGQFDASNLDEALQIHWVVSDRPLETVPYDVLLRQYYEPGLLKRVVQGETIAAPPAITTLNRTRPKVSFPSIVPTTPGSYRVTVQVDKVRQYGQDSGAADLRLFRDGQLVGYQEGPLTLGANGSFQKTFVVAVEERAGAADVEFSAYAFNTDRVKSETARKMVRVPAISSPRKPRAYLIAVGINQYQDPALRLNFAVNDARAVLQQLAPRLKATNRYSNIVSLALEDKMATKANLKAVLDRLSGKTTGTLPAGVPAFKDLLRANPGDMVFLSFSGHGSLGGRGEFFLISADGARVTADELAVWLRDVDATNMTLVIDACHSAASIEADKEFKPGPMGNRTLGQLAYDKGIRVLTATQSNNVALETKELSHGLLSYALITDGMEAGLADGSPKDDQLSMSEWLRYCVERVPVLYENLRTGKLAPAKGIEPVNILKKRLEVRRDLQQPALFDFTRGRFNNQMPLRKSP